MKRRIHSINRHWVFLTTLGSLAAVARPALAADLNADPSTYQSMIPDLEPGDTLHLAPGHYPRLSVNGVNGTADAWITITGPSSGEPVIVDADSGPCCNTIEVGDSSYVSIENVTVDGRGVDGAFGLSAKTGLVHHIRVQGCSFINHDASQGNVAISTKIPTWGWIIRGNTVTGAGTGLYLGNSNGAAPFVGGLIEGNLVMDTIGYNMQVKWQDTRPSVEGLPTEPTTTIIRHNVFIKNDRPSEGDRPNLLVGGFPDNGAGSEDRYEIYGNVFYHNPRESLLQASGRLTIHDNLFVDVEGAAIALRDHDLPLKQAFVYNNTIYGAGIGIALSGVAAQGSAVVGNLIFAEQPVAGSPDDQRDNITAEIADAASYVTNPSRMLGEFDLYPLEGQVQGDPIDPSTFASDTEYDRDFNGTSKGDVRFRGAYAGEGTNPGWKPVAGLKPLMDTGDGGTGDSDGATTSGGTSSDGGMLTGGDMPPDDGTGSGSDGAADTDPAGIMGSAGGCGCDVGTRPGRPPMGSALLLLGLGGWVVRRTRRGRTEVAVPLVRAVPFRGSGKFLRETPRLPRLANGRNRSEHDGSKTDVRRQPESGRPQRAALGTSELPMTDARRSVRAWRYAWVFNQR